MRFQIFTWLLWSFAACGQENNKSIWRSEHRLLSFPINSPWQQLPTLDTKQQTLSGVIDLSDGKSYTIKITEDVPKTKLSDNQYYAGAKKVMLEANKANKVIKEMDTVFHSLPTHRIDYVMNTDRWGLMKQVNYIIRDGRQFVSVQILYPVKEDESEEPLPAVLLAFDKSVLLDNK